VVIVNLITRTTTRSGLSVHAELDEGEYAARIKISDREMRVLERQAPTCAMRRRWVMWPHPVVM